MPKPTFERVDEQLEEKGGVYADDLRDWASWERSLWRSFPNKAEYDLNESSRHVMPLDGPMGDVGLPLPKTGAVNSNSGGTYFADCDTYRLRNAPKQTRYRFGNTGKRWQKKLSRKHYRQYYKAVGGRLRKISEHEAIEAVGAFPEIAYADQAEGQLEKLWDRLRRRAERMRDRAGSFARSKNMYGSGAYTERFTDGRGKKAKPRGQYEQERRHRMPETPADIADEIMREGKDPHDTSYGEDQDAGLTKDRWLPGNESEKDAVGTTADSTQPTVEELAEQLKEETENEKVWDHLKETSDYDPTPPETVADAIEEIGEEKPRRIQKPPPAKDRDND